MTKSTMECERERDKIIELRIKAHACSQRNTPDAIAEALELSTYADQLEEEVLHRKAFDKEMRGQNLDEDHVKAMSSHRSPDGGYLVPSSLIQEVLPLPLTHSPIRQYATVRTLTTGTEYPLPKLKTRPQTAWRGELDLHPVTTEMKFDGETIPTHQLVSTIAVSSKMVEDPTMPLEEWLFRPVKEAFLADEATEFVKGNGVNKPEGLLTHPGILTVNSGHASLVTADGVTSLYFKLPQASRAKGKWLMNGNTIEAVKKLKDTDGAYIFREGLFGLVPDTIHGHPVLECPDMPDIAAGTTPILFGDLSRYYIIDRVEMAVLRDPFSAKPMVIFDCVRRVGGQVVDATAFRKLLIAA